MPPRSIENGVTPPRNRASSGSLAKYSWAQPANTSGTIFAAPRRYTRLTCPPTRDRSELALRGSTASPAPSPPDSVKPSLPVGDVLQRDQRRERVVADRVVAAAAHVEREVLGVVVAAGDVIRAAHVDHPPQAVVVETAGQRQIEIPVVVEPRGVGTDAEGLDLAGREQVAGVDVGLVVSAADADDPVFVELFVDPELHAGRVRLEAEVVAGRTFAEEQAERIDPHRAGAIGVLQFVDRVPLAGAVVNHAGHLRRAAHGLGEGGRRLVGRRLAGTPG